MTLYYLKTIKTFSIWKYTYTWLKIIYGCVHPSLTKNIIYLFDGHKSHQKVMRSTLAIRSKPLMLMTSSKVMRCTFVYNTINRHRRIYRCYPEIHHRRMGTEQFCEFPCRYFDCKCNWKFLSGLDNVPF